jgi:hypothetical protein
MSNGVEQRSQIDIETVRALVAINGGGIVALLAFLPYLLAANVPSLLLLIRPIFYAVILMTCGLFIAVVHNIFRRRCSQIYSQNNMRPAPGKILGWTLRQPTVCAWCWAFAYFSVGFFVFGSATIAITGLLIF